MKKHSGVKQPTWWFERVLLRKLQPPHKDTALVRGAVRPLEHEVPLENIGREWSSGDMRRRLPGDISHLLPQAMLCRRWGFGWRKTGEKVSMRAESVQAAPDAHEVQGTACAKDRGNAPCMFSMPWLRGECAADVERRSDVDGGDGRGGGVWGEKGKSFVPLWTCTAVDWRKYRGWRNLRQARGGAAVRGCRTCSGGRGPFIGCASYRRFASTTRAFAKLRRGPPLYSSRCLQGTAGRPGHEAAGRGLSVAKVSRSSAKLGRHSEQKNTMASLHLVSIASSFVTFISEPRIKAIITPRLTTAARDWRLAQHYVSRGPRQKLITWYAHPVLFQ